MFDPDYIFRTTYFRCCHDAFLRTYDSSEVAEHLTDGVLKDLKRQFEYLGKGKARASELHATNILTKNGIWKHMKSNGTCLFCARRPPQHVLPCGHAICDNCVYRFGTPSFGLEYRYSLSRCTLCNSDERSLVRLKPPTSGFRGLAIDGGGTRGVIPLEIMRLLQSDLGDECSLNDFFDIVAGTQLRLVTSG